MKEVLIAGSFGPNRRSLGVAFVRRAIILVFCLSCVDSYHHSQYTDSWAVEVRGGRQMADRLAVKHGFTNVGQVGNLRDMYHFTLDSQEGLGEGRAGQRLSRNIHSLQSREDQLRTAALQRESSVGYTMQQELLQLEKKSYTPPLDPKWSSQWALKNVGQTSGLPGLDLNVEPVWVQGVTGRGVVVTVVDDGLEANHPDLQINFDTQASHDFIEHDSDPSPSGGDDYHGTACAGIIGMAQNGVCGVGVAPGTRLGGLRLDIGHSIDLTQANILSYQDGYVDVYSSSWGPTENGFTVGGPGYLTRETLKTETKQGRNSKGSIYVFASGNGGSYHDSCAADGYVNSIYTIAVGSADERGRQAFYDEKCSAKMALTFSHNSKSSASENRHDQLYTTSLNGQCSDSFTGTSASAPLLAGVIALALEANPDLSWRDIQYLIAYTSNIGILTLDDVETNGAGLQFSHSAGFGAIDAEAMVTRARHWTNVPAQISQSFTHDTVYIVPASGSIDIEFTVDNSRWNEYETVRFLEHVVLTVSLELRDYGQDYKVEDFWEFHETTVGNDTEELVAWLTDPHPRRGDIEIRLTSPRNTTSTLLPYRDYDFVNSEGYEDWPFMSVHNWGEDPHGTWTLRITYKSGSGYVYVDGVGLTLYGTSTTPKSVRDIPDECDAACSRARGCWGDGPGRCDVCRELRLDTTLECVEKCPPGYRQYSTYCICENCDSSVVNTTVTTETVDSASGDSGGGGDSVHWDLSLVLSLVASTLILLFLVVACFFAIQITRQHYCKSKHRLFSRLQDDIYPVTSV